MNTEKKKGSCFLTGLLVILFAIIFGVVSSFCFLGITYASNGLFKPILEKNVAANNEAKNNLIIQTNATLPDEVKEAIVINEVEDIVIENGTLTVPEVAEKCMPSIVQIIVIADYEYYGTVQEGTGAGSGIIVGQSDTELLIATNYHVIADGKDITIRFCDDSEAKAIVKGKKVSMDLAVVAVDLTQMPEGTLDKISIATIGNSDDLLIGESVVAIGNALGYGQSVTTGIVSALNREIVTETGETGNFIQTDAAINPGNSGGALINMKGELIGINSDKLAGSMIEGMGYAIPINEADPIIRELMNKEALEELPPEEQSYFGISGMEVSAGLYTNEGVAIPRGIYVSEVVPGATADTAGLKKGDIITEFEGDSIVSLAEFKKYLASYKKGSKAWITYERYDGTAYVEYKIEVTLQGRDDLETIQ